MSNDANGIHPNMNYYIKTGAENKRDSGAVQFLPSNGAVLHHQWRSIG